MNGTRPPETEPVSRPSVQAGTNHYDGGGSSSPGPLARSEVSSVARDTVSLYYRMNLEQNLLRGMGDKFDGNCGTYITWKRRMLEYTETAGSSDRIKIEILLANTEGYPREAVRQFYNSELTPHDQLRALWTRFDSRYGAPVRVARSLKEKLRKLK